MKELSIEEKAKAYDEAIERAKTKLTDEVAYSIFPELKESEDEKMRAMAIKAVYAPEAQSCIKSWGINPDDVIAWLEKQGERKPAEWDILSAKKGDMLSDGNIVLIVDSIEEFEGRPIINSWYFADSKKFYGKGTSECDRWDVHGFRTATETECNYLLKMIDNAGYEWDAEKKELKKIEQKPAWSEEDAKILNRISAILVDASEVKNWWKEYRLIEREEMIKLTDFLKSLKDRFTWKPSGEQMEALEHFVRSIGESGYASPYDNNTKLLYSLLSDLKKLK